MVDVSVVDLDVDQLHVFESLYKSGDSLFGLEYTTEIYVHWKEPKTIIGGRAAGGSHPRTEKSAESHMSSSLRVCLNSLPHETAMDSGAGAKKIFGRSRSRSLSNSLFRKGNETMQLLLDVKLKG